MIKTIEDKLAKQDLQYLRWERVVASNVIRLHAEPTAALAAVVLKEKFPSEPDDVFLYRLQNFNFFTKSYFDKIYSLLFRLQTSSEFYVEYNQPMYEQWVRSFYAKDPLAWTFDNLLYPTLVDPNALYIMPTPMPDFNETFTGIYPSYRLLYVQKDRDGRLIEAIIDISEDLKYKRGISSNIYLPGNRLLAVSPDRFSILERDSYSKSWTLAYDFPCFGANKYAIAMVGNPAGMEFDHNVSLIHGIADPFKAALISLSDYTCALKQHVYPEKYRYTDKKCTACSGSGTVRFRDPVSLFETTGVCSACKGSGAPATGVFSEMQITVGGGGLMDERIPNPPVGYVQKDIETVGFIRDSYYEFVKEGLASLSMEFLGESGLNQSGFSKEMDRAEFNMFLGSVALKISTLIKHVCEAQWLLYSAKPEISGLAPGLTEMYLPTISVPARFDTLYFDSTLPDLTAMRQAGVSTTILKEYERNLVSSDKRANYILDLDPLYGYSFDEKMQMMGGGLVSKLDVYVSMNIDSLVQEVSRSEADFWSRKNMNIVTQKIYALAKARLLAIDTEAEGKEDPPVPEPEPVPEPGDPDFD